MLLMLYTYTYVYAYLPLLILNFTTKRDIKKIVIVSIVRAINVKTVHCKYFNFLYGLKAYFRY